LAIPFIVVMEVHPAFERAPVGVADRPGPELGEGLAGPDEGVIGDDRSTVEALLRVAVRADGPGHDRQRPHQVGRAVARSDDPEVSGRADVVDRPGNEAVPEPDVALVDVLVVAGIEIAAVCAGLREGEIELVGTSAPGRRELAVVGPGLGILVRDAVMGCRAYRDRSGP